MRDLCESPAATICREPTRDYKTTLFAESFDRSAWLSREFNTVPLVSGFAYIYIYILTYMYNTRVPLANVSATFRKRFDASLKDHGSDNYSIF